MKSETSFIILSFQDAPKQPPFNYEGEGGWTNRKHFIQKVFMLTTKEGFLGMFKKNHVDIEPLMDDNNNYIGFDSLEDAKLEIDSYKKQLPKTIYVK